MGSLQTKKSIKLLFTTVLTPAMSIVICLAVFVPTEVFAQTDEINQCRVIQDSTKRLACYDKMYGRINLDGSQVSNAAKQVAKELDPIEQRAQALMSKSNTSSSPFDGSKARLDSNPSKIVLSDDSFGAEQIENSSSSDSDQMLAVIKAIDTNPRDLRTISLSNGQVWRELQSSTLNLDVGADIIIKKGLVGGYLLSTESSNRISRVKRIE